MNADIFHLYYLAEAARWYFEYYLQDDAAFLGMSILPIQYGWIVPKDDLVHTIIYRKRISKRKIEELAIQKYRKCGKGIDFKDSVREFGCSKKKSKRVLKDCCQQRIGTDGTLCTVIKIQ